MTEVREITSRALMRESSVINSSVMASAKYSCPGSPERFCRGRTASEWTGEAVTPNTRARMPSTLLRNTPSSTAAPARIIPGCLSFLQATEAHVLRNASVCAPGCVVAGSASPVAGTTGATSQHDNRKSPSTTHPRREFRDYTPFGHSISPYLAKTYEKPRAFLRTSGPYLVNVGQKVRKPDSEGC